MFWTPSSNFSHARRLEYDLSRSQNLRYCFENQVLETRFHKQAKIAVYLTIVGYSPTLQVYLFSTGCPKKHGNSVMNSISSLLWISIVIPNFKSLNIIMPARVYFMKSVKGCKDVSIMSPQHEQWRRKSLLCLCTAIFLFY